MKTIAFLLLLSPVVFAQQKPSPKPAAPKYACTAGADEKCPDAADYSRLKAYLDKYKPPKPPQDEVDLMNGIWQRVASNPPAGYHWDNIKLLYVKNPPPAAPPTGAKQ